MSGKRANGEGSIFYRADRRRWCAQVTLGSGRRRAIYGSTRQEVARKMRDALSSHALGIQPEDRRRTVRRFLEEWLRDAVKPHVRPSTHTGYEVIVRVHLLPSLGQLALTDLSPQHVQNLVNQKSAAGLSPKSVQYIRGVLRAALNDAVRWELVSRNVATLVKVPRVERKEIRPFTPSEARILLAACRFDRLGVLYATGLSLGLRQGEALGLTWDRIDLKAGTMRVDRQLQRVEGKLQLVPLKTEASRRTLALPEIIARRLEGHWHDQHREKMAAGSRWVDTGLVFTTPIGTGLDGTRVTKQFQHLLERAGLARRRFHDLRHSCASLLLAQNVSPRVVMEILGHSQIALTMNTYAHVMPEQTRNAASSMDEVLGNKPRGHTRGSP